MSDRLAYRGRTFNSFDEARQSDLMFEPIEKGVYFRDNLYKDYKLLNNNKVIVKESKNKEHLIPISVVNDTYKVISNQEVFNYIEEQIINHFGSDVMVTIHDSMAYNGRLSIRQLILDDFQFEGDKGKPIKYRVICINSFDGSKSFKILFGLIDFFCMNGLVLGEYDKYTHKHTSGFSIPKMGELFNQSIDTFKEAENRIHEWRGITFTQESVQAFLEDYCNSPQQVEKYLTQLLFNEQYVRGGLNIWALVSAFTASVHDKVRQTRNSELSHNQTILNREREIAKLVNHNKFIWFVSQSKIGRQYIEV